MSLVNLDAAMLIPLIPVLILAVLLIGWSLIDIVLGTGSLKRRGNDREAPW